MGFPAPPKADKCPRRAILKRGPILESQANETLPVSLLASLLDLLEQPILVSDRSGRILLANARATQRLEFHGFTFDANLNLFSDVLRVHQKVILDQIEGGEHPVDREFGGRSGMVFARIQWLPEGDWLVVRIEDAEERKAVALASAAHELKTPLAVIKGYYDLLLSGSLGKLTDKQRDILQESKDSSERLVRLVSMFLNYSALESGKLVLHLRENDLRDCLGELATRWHEAFVRKQVRLDATLSGDLPIFKFDYQKVQQTVANLLDNALKHTPAGGHVKLRAEVHFWERRSAEELQSVERRRERVQRPNSLKVSVSDTGPGIASEHHQEIFEDFVRVDRTSSGMGLGLAIAKRLVQAHCGKIWVESEPRRGCTFTFLLPMDNL